MTAFASDVATSLAATIHQHRHNFDDRDRRLAMALIEVVDAPVEVLDELLERCRQIDDEAGPLERRQGVNAAIGRAIRACGPLHRADDPLGDGQVGKSGLKVAGVDESVGEGALGRGNADQRLKFPDRGDDRLDGVDAPVQAFDQLVGGRLLRDEARVERLGHHSLLALARAATRYVAGALLASLRWLQRRAWVRRAAAILRPSDTTKGGAA